MYDVLKITLTCVDNFSPTQLVGPVNGWTIAPLAERQSADSPCP